MNRIISKLTYTRLVAAGFLLIILIGTGLLMLPIASKGTSAGFTEAFFTATSTTCVTGLIVYDTFTQWSLFGQIVIIVLIQVGGLGFFTVIAFFSFLCGKKIGLKSRELLKESVNAFNIGGIIKLVKRILLGTAIVEGIGAVILSIRFIPVFGVAKGIYYGIFHSISAFCNAGFDLMGVTEPYSSVTAFGSDSIVMLTLSALILIGGIGFFVWNDVVNYGLRLKRYSLHSKIALSVTAFLTVGGTVAIFFFEQKGLLANYNLWDKICVSIFSCVTPRTAGFNAIDVATMCGGAKLVTIILMAIGGSPGSTAGGMKTTTIAALFITGWTSIKQSRGDSVFGRRLDESAVKKSAAVIAVYAVLVSVGLIVLCAENPSMPLEDITLEVVSAASTVGMSAGITRDITLLSKWILIALMYFGRVGSTSFIAAFAQKKVGAAAMKPKEDISIG